MSDTSNRDTRRGRPRPMHRRDEGHHRDGSGSRDGNSRERNGDTTIDRELLAELEREEPLSLAEELDKAAERVRRVGAAIARSDAQDRNIHIAELQRMTMPQLIEAAEKEKLTEITGLKKQELIFRILKERVKLKGLMYGEGTLEILPDGFGFLRSPDYHYLSCPDDIYVSPSQIRRFGLQNGNTVAGTIRPPKENERYFALLRVEAINGDDPNLLAKKIFFDDLTPEHPDKRIVMETKAEDIETRVVDMIVPIGFGQRGLIVSPPRAGKTILMQKMAKAVLANYPDAYVIMLLIDERPEEVTDMERQIKGPHCEVISSTFDETSARHVQVSEMVIEKAKRMVEYGRDVIIFLDSITRLARAWNAECPHSGKILSGGIDANAMQRPKRFFGSARRVQEGGSLTIIATALVDTGSRMDEVIFEEFKGTGNQEIVLDRRLVDRRIWPAIDIGRSGTRKEEMLMDPEEHRRVCLLRRVINDMNPPDAMELLVNRLQKTKTNAEFLMSVKEDR
jgi:transcription termination factor Rho